MHHLKRMARTRAMSMEDFDLPRNVRARNASGSGAPKPAAGKSVTPRTTINQRGLTSPTVYIYRSRTVHVQYMYTYVHVLPVCMLVPT